MNGYRVEQGGFLLTRQHDRNGPAQANINELQDRNSVLTVAQRLYDRVIPYYIHLNPNIELSGKRDTENRLIRWSLPVSAYLTTIHPIRDSIDGSCR